MFFRGLRLPEEPSFPNCAVESLMFCSLLMSTSSRTNKYWPRWVWMYKKTQAEGHAQTHPGRHSITHPSLHMHTTRFHCLFVALCFCLSAPAPQIPKVPSKYLTVANLTAPCAASQCFLLGADTACIPSLPLPSMAVMLLCTHVVI